MTNPSEEQPAERPHERTWHGIREYMRSKYEGKYYTHRDLRDMEIKWRRIFTAAGWNTKGQ